MGCASAKQLWDVTRRIVMALRELVEAPQVDCLLAALTADLVIPILTTRLTTAFTATMARCSWLISIAALIVVLAAPLSPPSPASTGSAPSIRLLRALKIGAQRAATGVATHCLRCHHLK
jgi:hypothetical protein